MVTIYGFPTSCVTIVLTQIKNYVLSYFLHIEHGNHIWLSHLMCNNWSWHKLKTMSWAISYTSTMVTIYGYPTWCVNFDPDTKWKYVVTYMLHIEHGNHIWFSARCVKNWSWHKIKIGNNLYFYTSSMSTIYGYPARCIKWFCTWDRCALCLRQLT